MTKFPSTFNNPATLELEQQLLKPSGSVPDWESSLLLLLSTGLMATAGFRPPPQRTFQAGDGTL